MEVIEWTKLLIWTLPKLHKHTVEDVTNDLRWILSPHQNFPAYWLLGFTLYWPHSHSLYRSSIYSVLGTILFPQMKSSVRVHDAYWTAHFLLLTSMRRDIVLTLRLNSSMPPGAEQCAGFNCKENFVQSDSTLNSYHARVCQIVRLHDEILEW